ncbi:MAG: TldD/PmbA family protein [Candidatus Coatesbacteria bacterium]|nr:TldD/PmbA family protein [Candidatus Coatesbacteria bacterium]
MTRKEDRINLAEIGDQVLDLAKKSGADQAEVYVEASSTTAVYVKDQGIENLTATDTAGIGLRVLKGSSLGFGTANRFDLDSLKRLVESTVACAKGSTPDEFNCFARPEAHVCGDLRILDERIGSVPVEEKIERGFLLESSARAFDGRIKRTAYVVYVDGLSSVGIYNTLGVSSEYSSSSCQGVSWVAAVEGSSVESGISEAASTTFEGLDCEAIGRDAAKRAVALLGGKQMCSGRMPVVLDGRAAGQFLIFLAMLISADNVQKGKSMLADKLGEKIASSRVSIFDDGLLPGGPSTTPVDDVGVPRQRTAIVEKGELKAFIHDCYTAKRASTTSTGNAIRRGYRASPAVGTTSFLVEPGEANRRQILAEAGDGVLITSIRDLFAGIDIATGDFSIPAQGLKIEGGESAAPVKDFHISGNLFKMLSDVVLIGDEIIWSSAARFGTPDLLIRTLSIAGS